jgi:hypothetical protein
MFFFNTILSLDWFGLNNTMGFGDPLDVLCIRPSYSIKPLKVLGRVDRVPQRVKTLSVAVSAELFDRFR